MTWVLLNSLLMSGLAAATVIFAGWLVSSHARMVKQGWVCPLCGNQLPNKRGRNRPDRHLIYVHEPRGPEDNDEWLANL